MTSNSLCSTHTHIQSSAIWHSGCHYPQDFGIWMLNTSPQWVRKVLRSACVDVCLSSRLHTSKITSPNSTDVSVYINMTWGPPLTLCTSGVVEDVKVSHNEANWPKPSTMICFAKFAGWQTPDYVMLGRVRQIAALGRVAVYDLRLVLNCLLLPDNKGLAGELQKWSTFNCSKTKLS